MTAVGWIFMGLSWLAIGSLVAFCLNKVLRSNPRSGGDQAS